MSVDVLELVVGPPVVLHSGSLGPVVGLRSVTFLVSQVVSKVVEVSSYYYPLLNI